MTQAGALAPTADYSARIRRFAIAKFSRDPNLLIGTGHRKRKNLPTGQAFRVSPMNDTFVPQHGRYLQVTTWHTP